MEVEFPAALEFLLHPSRYKVAYGGRGSAKSWSYARALLLHGVQRPERIPCLREFQKSIGDSVHALLKSQISALGLDGFYDIKETYIEGQNGTLFTFHGLRHNVSNIKSLEGATKAWVEEAQAVSKSSWDVLIPTIRAAGSEIWVSYNPELETDETHQRFVIRPPTGSVVRKVNYSDNPWFPEVLRQEMEDMKARDYASYLTVWEGHCRQAVEGAIYAKELQEAEARITSVPYDRTKPVETFWDLGFADNTSVIFAQWVGFELRVIDYVQDSRRPLVDYLKILKEKPYLYGTDWLPHDARAKQLGTGKSIEEMMREAGRSVRIVPQLSIEDGINAARTLFTSTWFDRAKCADLLHCLRHYRYDVDQDTGKISRKPLHDWSSHGADAFRYLAVASKPETSGTYRYDPASFESEFA